MSGWCVAVAAIRPAYVVERATLVELMWRASLVWESERAALLDHPEAVDVPAERIAAGQVRVACIDGRIVGFSVAVPVDANTVELDGLFVEPDVMRTGVGRALVVEVVATARGEGRTRIEVTANLHAHRFYERVGFVARERIQTRFAPALRMRRPVDAEE